MTYKTLALCGLIALPLHAQTPPQGDAKVVIETATNTFFTLLPQQDFAAEFAMMSPRLANTTTLADWTSLRMSFIDVIGQTPQYTAHRTTYYARETQLGAVDYSGQIPEMDAVICGFVLWEIAQDDSIAFTRFEQNLITGDVFRNMPVAEAAQRMADWYCPTTLIASYLDIALQ